MCRNVPKYSNLVTLVCEVTSQDHQCVYEIMESSRLYRLSFVYICNNNTF